MTGSIILLNVADRLFQRAVVIILQPPSTCCSTRGLRLPAGGQSPARPGARPKRLTTGGAAAGVGHRGHPGRVPTRTGRPAPPGVQKMLRAVTDGASRDGFARPEPLPDCAGRGVLAVDALNVCTCTMPWTGPGGGTSPDCPWSGGGRPAGPLPKSEDRPIWRGPSCDRLLLPAGMPFKDSAGHAVSDLGGGEPADWLGLTVTGRARGLAFRFGDRAWGRLDRLFAPAHKKSQPSLRAVDAVIMPWLRHRTPCYPASDPAGVCREVVTAPTLTPSRRCRRPTSWGRLAAPTGVGGGCGRRCGQDTGRPARHVTPGARRDPQVIRSGRPRHVQDDASQAPTDGPPLGRVRREGVPPAVAGRGRIGRKPAVCDRRPDEGDEDVPGSRPRRQPRDRHAVPRPVRRAKPQAGGRSLRGERGGHDPGDRSPGLPPQGGGSSGPTATCSGGSACPDWAARRTAGNSAACSKRMPSRW